MRAEQSLYAAFESGWAKYAGVSADELSEVVLERFDDTFPPEGLQAGGFPDRVREFVSNRVKYVCDTTGAVGAAIWRSLHDPHTAHDLERFALVCGFFAADVLHVGHWPAHEVAALVLLVISITSKSKG